MSKIDRIIKQLEDGTYKVSPEQIAEKLLKKNPLLTDRMAMETKVVGQISRGLSVSDYMDAGCTHIFQFDFLYNGVPYGYYLIGLYPDYTAIVLDVAGDNFEEFDDDGEMGEAFDEALEDRIEELGLE